MKIILDDLELKRIADQIVNDVADMEGWAGDKHQITALVDDMYIANREFKRRVRKTLQEWLR